MNRGVIRPGALRILIDDFLVISIRIAFPSRYLFKTESDPKKGIIAVQTARVLLKQLLVGLYCFLPSTLPDVFSSFPVENHFILIITQHSPGTQDDTQPEDDQGMNKAVLIFFFELTHCQRILPYTAPASRVRD